MRRNIYEINELFKQEYQGKEISYLLNGEEIKALINSTTRINFRAYQHSGKFETNKSYRTRQNIAFSGDYIDMISNIPYNYSKDEHKEHQKRHHKIISGIISLKLLSVIIAFILLILILLKEIVIIIFIIQN